jgi:hypothetical protein
MKSLLLAVIEWIMNTLDEAYSEERFTMSEQEKDGWTMARNEIERKLKEVE